MTSPSIIRIITDNFNAAVTTYMSGRQASLEAPAEPSPIEGAEKLFTNADEIWDTIGQEVEASEWYLSLIDGSPGSGKTSIAYELFHKAHQQGFGGIYVSGFDLAQLSSILHDYQLAHKKEKICLILDDISYLMQTFSGKKQGELKNLLSMLRHVTSARLFCIVVSHFSSGVPPMFRATSGAYFFTSPNLVEMPFMKLLVGREQSNKTKLLEMFKAVVALKNEAQKNPDLRFNWRGHPYQFRWGNRNDLGDGRLSLMLHSGESILYNSKVIRGCAECEALGKSKVDLSKYTDKPKEGPV